MNTFNIHTNLLNVDVIGFICPAKLGFYSRCQPLCERSPENHEPEGHGTAVLPIWSYNYIPHPSGPSHRYSNISLLMLSLKQHFSE